MTILDLGCGGGEDALWLASLGHRVLAVDNDPACLSAAAATARDFAAGLELQFAELDINTCSPDRFSSEFDFLLCNSGVLNFVNRDAVRRLGVAATNWMRPGGRMLFVAMCRGRSIAASTDARSSHQLWIHTPKELREAFSPAFCVRRLSAISIAMAHPNRSGSWWSRQPGIAALGAIDTLLSSVPGSQHIAGTFALDLEKRDTKTVTSGWKKQAWQGNAPAPAASFQATHDDFGAASARSQSARSAMER